MLSCGPVSSPPRRGPCSSPNCSAPYNRKSRGNDFSHFIENPPAVAQGGKGVVVPGCPACKKRINTMSQFLDHLADDAMPALLNRLSAAEATISS